MPQFIKASLEEAKRATGGIKRRMVLTEYIDSIGRLSKGEASKAVPSDGETLSMVRRRLGDAARLSGTVVEIRRTDDGVYYWLKERRRRGRPRTHRS